jgi:hypothetical protein
MQFIDTAMSAKISHGNGRGNFLFVANEHKVLERCLP